MRKIVIVLLLVFISSFLTKESNASEYLTYQEIEFEQHGAKLLEDYSNGEYEKYYEKLTKKRFWGWRTFIRFENEEVAFLKDTLFVIVNEGESPITESFSIKKEEYVKKQYSVTGTLGLDVNATEKGFKLGLEENLKFSITKTIYSEIEEEFEIKVLVDSMTKLTVEVRGEGKVSNGIAKYYRFFKNVKKGGWEIFVVTTEYYSLNKEVIDEN
jgi:hypothetical protein